MSVRITALSIAALALATSLSGCNPYPLPGPLHYDRCGPDAHLEAYPHAKRARNAYGCRSNDAGYLEGPGQGDKRRN